MTQRALERVRRIELSLGVEPSHYEQTRAHAAGPGREAEDVGDPGTGEIERIGA
jgi:hypothetical protein